MSALPYRARIIGTGSYVPDRVVTNDDWAEKVDTTDEWITTRTGIKERRWVEPGTGTADMAEHAARKALDDAGLAAEDIELIVFATVTPDMRLPSAAALLQEKLGARNAAGFDIAAACAGSVYAFSIAERYVATGMYKNALVVGGETLTSIFNHADRATAVLFGDAAGAAVITQAPADGAGFLDFNLRLDGTAWEAIHIPKGGSREPPGPDTSADDYKMRMNGREVYKIAVRALTKTSTDILEANGYSIDDVKWVVAHQANQRIIEAVSDRLQLPMDRWIMNLEHYGNTSAASVMLTFDEGLRDERIQAGDLVLMLGIGAGLTWAGALYRA
jgi:3-oxoacyl-[acyl-carrier-protein] synthase-3